MRLQRGTGLGRYVIRDFLGAGGMGAVYRAHDPATGREVAIKTISAEGLTPGTRARFIREAQVVARMEHPNVVRLYDVGIHDGHPFMVMQLLHGEDLAALLARQSVLAVHEAVNVVLGICSGVAYCHQAGVSHRDLKPRNVFLAREGPVVYTRVFDFGLAKDLLSAELTFSEQMVGTPGYLAPEEAAKGLRRQNDGSVAPSPPATFVQASDQYSIGVILYRCVTGRLPHESSVGLSAFLESIVSGQFPAPCSIRPEVPADLEAVILRAMARSPFDRFESVHELGRQLYPFVSEQQRYQFQHFLRSPQPVPTHITRPHGVNQLAIEDTPPIGASGANQLHRQPPPSAPAIGAQSEEITAPLRHYASPLDSPGSSNVERAVLTSDNQTPPPPEPRPQARPSSSKLLRRGSVVAVLGAAVAAIVLLQRDSFLSPGTTPAAPVVSRSASEQLSPAAPASSVSPPTTPGALTAGGQPPDAHPLSPIGDRRPSEAPPKSTSSPLLGGASKSLQRSQKKPNAAVPDSRSRRLYGSRERASPDGETIWRPVKGSTESPSPDPEPSRWRRLYEKPPKARPDAKGSPREPSPAPSREWEKDVDGVPILR